MHSSLYKAMKAKAPNPDKITIAAWIFTHTHGDHIGAFKGIVSNFSTYSSKIIIESFVYNLAGSEQALVPNQNLTADDGIRQNIKNTFSSAKRYKVHPGNELNFANMKIQVLATHESYIQEKYPVFQNACCLVLRIEIGGQVIMIEGDTSVQNNVILSDNYGDYLKCDILQATHHGDFGGNVETNLQFAPEIILFFTYNSESTILGKVWNKPLIDNRNPNFKEYLFLKNETVYIPLPYTAGSSYILK